MPDEAIIKTIDLIIAPVVMITACAIIVNGLIVRYAALAEKVRATHAEQMKLLEIDLQLSALKRHQLEELEELLPDLLDHHHQVHDALVAVYLAILIFLLDMIAIAVAVSTHQSWLSQVVVIIFLIGVAILFWSMVQIALELRSSHGLIQREVHQNCRLCKK